MENMHTNGTRAVNGHPLHCQRWEFGYIIELFGILCNWQRQSQHSPFYVLHYITALV